MIGVLGLMFTYGILLKDMTIQSSKHADKLWIVIVAVSVVIVLALSYVYFSIDIDEKFSNKSKK